MNDNNSYWLFISQELQKICDKYAYYYYEYEHNIGGVVYNTSLWDEINKTIGRGIFDYVGCVTITTILGTKIRFSEGFRKWEIIE